MYFSRRVPVLLLVFITMAFRAFAVPAGDDQAVTTRMIHELVKANDSSKIDLLLKISDDLLKTNPADAYQYARDAADLAEKIRDARRVGLSSLALGDYYRVTDEYDKAMDSYLKALKEFQNRKDTLNIALCFNQIGMVHMLTNNFREAYSCYHRAVNLNKEVGGYRQVAVNYMNMGLNCLKVDSVDKGLSYFLVSMVLADSLDMKPEKIILMKNIGYAYAMLGKNQDALEHYYKVLELLGDQPDDLTRSEAQLNIARGYFELKNYAAAIKYGEMSYKLSSAKNFDHISRDAAGLLADVFAARNDYKQAYEYVKIYRNLADSILNADRNQELSRIQAIYNVDQKEQENVSLRKQFFHTVQVMRIRTLLIILITMLVLVLAVLLYLVNRMNNKHVALNKKLAAQSHEMEALNDMKDKFFSFVAHNLKNPFNTIMGFSELMHRAADSNDIVKAREYSVLIYDLSTQVQKVLSNLLEWSRLQRRTFEVKPEMVDITGLIKDVVEMNTREAARKDINLGMKSDGNIFVIADRSMITTVLQNLVMNAIHFTPPSGKIEISCRMKNQFTEVSIMDTGIGMTRDKLDTLFDFDYSQAKLGLSDHGGSGLGLIICHEMLVKNGGTIRAISDPGKGSTFIFTLPVAVRHDQGPEIFDPVESTPEEVAENLLLSETTVNDAFIRDMKNTVIPQYEEVSRVLSIEELQHFSKILIHTGEKYNNLALAGYGKSLQSLTLGHQIDQIIRILPRFREYLKKIRVV
ncbi:MAG TPA: ATP-binding protein [Bacteroidales bacterium]|nr:ATP-binding protein [Bacteroidales bacterium]